MAAQSGHVNRLICTSPLAPLINLKRIIHRFQQELSVLGYHSVGAFWGWPAAVPPGTRSTQRKPMWVEDVSTAFSWRAAGR
jgi:hypothetical protein